jgi:hypothetical protein
MKSNVFLSMWNYGSDQKKFFLSRYYSSATNRLITAKDHASVQINVSDVDAEGRATNSFATYAFCGFLRKEAESDDALNRIAQQDGCK